MTELRDISGSSVYQASKQWYATYVYDRMYERVSEERAFLIIGIILQVFAGV